MISLQDPRLLQCRQYETAYPLSFPWNDQVRADVPRYFREADGWWRSKDAQPSGKALLCCTGDLMCEPRQTRACQYGDSYFFQPMFQFVRSILRGGDFTVGNLETTVSDMTPYAGAYHTVAKKYHCNAPESYLEALRYAGFDALVNANNHNCDSGAAGLIETNERIDRHGFMRTGTFLPGQTERALLVEVNGIRLAVLSYGTFYNRLDAYFTQLGNDALLNHFSPEKAAADVAWAKERGAEFVLSYIHWGKSYIHYPTDVQREQAQALADAGVDYIVGSHSHCLQIADTVAAADGRKVPVIFSMGNFVTNESQQLCRYCGVLQLYLEKAVDGIRVKDWFVPCFVFDEFSTGSFACVPVDTLHNGGWDHPLLHTTREFVQSLLPGLPEPVSGRITAPELCELWNIPLPEGMEYTAYQGICVQSDQLQPHSLYFALGPQSDYDLLMVRRRRPVTLVTDKPIEGYTCLVVPDMKQAYITLCKALRSRFDSQLVLVAGPADKTETRCRIAQALKSKYRVLTHADGVFIDSAPWQHLHPSQDYCVQELRPDYPLGYAVAMEAMAPRICVLTGCMPGIDELVSALPENSILLYNAADAALAAKLAGIPNATGYHDAALAVGERAGIIPEAAQAALAAYRYPGFEKNRFACGDVTVLTDYACKSEASAKASVDALLACPGQKIAVMEDRYAPLAAAADVVLAVPPVPEDRDARFAAEHALEQKILAALEPGALVLLCGGRSMEFNVTLRRVFGPTDGVITDTW